MFFRSPPWHEVVYWALDLELSGLQRSDEILSVGMVPIREGTIRWGEHFYSLVRPRNQSGLTIETMRIHHILPEELTSAPQPSDVISEISLRLHEGEALIVHHAPIDVAFLRRAFRTESLVWPRISIVDTRVLVARLEERQQRLKPFAPALPRGLPELRELFDLPQFEAHHALGDALATAELFLALRARLGATTLRQLRSRLL